MNSEQLAYELIDTLQMINWKAREAGRYRGADFERNRRIILQSILEMSSEMIEKIKEDDEHKWRLEPKTKG